MKKSKINKIVIFTQPAKGGEQSIKTVKVVVKMAVKTQCITSLRPRASFFYFSDNQSFQYTIYPQGVKFQSGEIK